MKRLSDALGVSRSHLSESLQRAPRPRGPYHNTGDAELLCRIEVLVAARPSYGYRRITALLNRDNSAQERVNHKRVYRVMRDAGLLLPKYSGKVERPHEGQVITLKSDLRWCSDMFEIRCWDGDKVHVAFSLDCCDRECISWVAAPRHLDGSDVRDLMAQSVEARFGSQSPWQNPYCEPVIGTLRRECLDHMIVLGERHLRRILRQYLEYYHESRTHLGLDKDAPEPRERETADGGKVVALPMVGGLHHRYSRRAA